jgi:hypothetical protein
MGSFVAFHLEFPILKYEQVFERSTYDHVLVFQVVGQLYIIQQIPMPPKKK